MALTTYYFTVCPEALVGSQPLYLYTSATLDGSKLKATVYSGPAYLTLSTNTTYSVSSNTNATYVWVSTNSSTYEDNGYFFADGDKYMYFDNLTANPSMSIVTYIAVRGATLIDRLKIDDDLYDITLPGIDGVTTSVNANSTHRDLATAKAVYDAIGASGGGTVTSVGAGAGLSISGTATINPTVNIASNYKLPTTTEWNGKLDKVTYEWNKELACGSNGKVCIGKFGCYDTNVTIELRCTTSTTYNATIVIATQNIVKNGTGGTIQVGVYGDASNSITPLLVIFRPYGSADRLVEVYANLPGWSKNFVHVKQLGAASSETTDILTSVTAIPEEITGKIKVTPVNKLTAVIPTKVSDLTNDAGYTTNTGTVTSVGAGTGLSISGTASVTPTVNVASDYKLPTTDEWKDSSIYSVVSGITTSAGSASSPYLSVKWTVDDVSGITIPYDGMKIVIRIPLAGVGTAGVLLSIDGGTTYHPVAYNVNTPLTTHYPVNTNKVFVFNATQKMNGYPSASATATTFTGVWQGESNYDSNTTVTYGTLAYYFRPYAAQAIYRYKLVALDHDNRLVPMSTTNLSETVYADYASSINYAKDVVVHRYASSVSKWYKSLAASNKGHAPESSPTWWSEVTPNTPTSLAFRPDKIYWYNTTATINAGAVIGGNTLVSVGYNYPYMAYCNFNEGILAYRVFYLCGTYNQTTGLFTLRDGGTAGSKLYYTTAPTNTANLTLSNYFTSGYDYILVGGSYSSNNYTHIREDHPMFHFDGTNLVPYDTWLANTKGIGTVTSVNNVTPVSGNVTLTIPTLSSSGNGSITDGTTTLTFGSNAFNSTTIPTSYVSSVNGSTGAITNVITENDLVSGNKTVLLHEVEIPGDKPVNMCYDGNNDSLRISDTTTLQAGPGFEFSADAVRIFEETSTPGTYSYSPVASHLYVQTQLTPQLRTYTTSANNRFRFNIGNLTNIQGLGIFSFGNCNTMINLYGLTLGTTYKQVGTFIYDSSGSVITTTINIAYVQVDGSYYLDITSGNSNFPIINGYTGYLFTLKLY